MQFHGLPVSTLMQVGAVAGALVVAAYILKLKRRPVPVAFVQLWSQLLREKEATSLFSHLKRVLSLLLQLALLAALVFALGDPRTASGVIKGRNLVLLIDASASMQATDGTPTRLAAARARAHELLRGLGGSDRALVAQMDSVVTPLSTMTDDVPTLQAAVDRVKATDSPVQFAPALRFAVDALRGVSHPEIVVLSDGRLGPARDASGSVHLDGIKFSYEKFGSSKANAAITGFSVRRYPLDKSRYEVMLEVTNTSDVAMELELSIYGDGVLVDMSRLKLAAHERLPRFYPNMSGASHALEARIRTLRGPADALPVDNRAFALLPERRRARVLCVTSGNTYLEAALLLDEYLEVTTIEPSAYPLPGDHQFDVTIFDNVAPQLAAGAGSVLYLNPSGPHAPLEIKKKIKDIGFDTWDKNSPLLRWTAVGDVNIAEASKVKLQKVDKVIGGSFDGPLLVMGRRGGHRFVSVNFDIRDSDLPLRISWPLIVLNTINQFTGEDTSYISSYRTGQVWHIPTPQGAREAKLQLPDGKTQPVPIIGGSAVFLGQRAGVYTLEIGHGADLIKSSFAANLRDPHESTVAPVDQLKVAKITAGQVTGFHVGVRRQLWIYFLLAVIGLTTIEWITYHRRVTV